MTSTTFTSRHIGPNSAEQQRMLKTLGYDNLDTFIDAVIPSNIRRTNFNVGAFTQGLSEESALAKLRAHAQQNTVNTSLIGQGYYGTHTPTVILRNILENPAWYTAYTPYQPEISQGRLEALLNFQQMIMDLTGMDIANASMLDEATAAAEAMTLAHRQSKLDSNVFYVAENVFPQTREVIETRAKPLGIEVRTCITGEESLADDCFAVLVQYPSANGAVIDYSDWVAKAHTQGKTVIAAADLLALTILKSPAEWGADIVIGNTQRFGVPFGFGGPHAAYMATRDAYKRNMPGRLVGVSVDAQGNSALRLALQTREQHIRREKATSNICTAQALLAIMASMYAVYHGPAGLKKIAERVYGITTAVANSLSQAGAHVVNSTWFDTLTLKVTDADNIHQAAHAKGINLRAIDANHVGISFDETTTL
ncbi:MAG: glycine dehydrogenase (aminomethyl-transferring), partial [Burkholderiales bacterium]|nr:glycine dehydrogenase (aminomethyl-transferring) [Burkholderiales bacterium]